MNTFFREPEMTLEEKKYRLKYLYMIDIDKTLFFIKNSNEYKHFYQNQNDSQLMDNLFYKIFNEIFDSAKPYTSYMDTETPQYNAFFGYPTDHQESYNYQKRLALMKLCLRNHCIIHGLFTSFKTESFKNGSTKCSELSGARDRFNKTGFFSDPIYDKTKHKPIKELQGENTIYQTYNSAYHSYQQQPADYYSHAIMNVLTIERKQQNRLKVFLVPIYLKNVLYTLFREPSVNAFNRALLKTNTPANFFKQYLYLYETYNNNAAKLVHKCDQLIYKGMYEYFYGFSLISYIGNLLSDIHTSSSNSSHFTPKDLESQALINILSKILDCPLVFSRSFLLKHVYETIIHTDNIHQHYMSHDIRSIVSSVPQKNESGKSAMIYTALKLMDNFFSVVNSLTLPILEDFWDFIISELNITDIEYYKDYIIRHYDMLTFDYSILSKEELSLFIFLGNGTKESFPKSIGLSDGCFDAYIEQILLNPLNEGTFSQLVPTFTINDLQHGRLPLYVRSSIQNLLKNTFSSERFRTDRSTSISSKMFNNNQISSRVTSFDTLKHNHVKQILDFINS